MLRLSVVRIHEYQSVVNTSFQSIALCISASNKRMVFLTNKRLAIPCTHCLNKFVKGGYNKSIRRKSQRGAVVARGNSWDTGDLSMCLNDRIISFDSWYAEQNALTSLSSSTEGGQISTLPTPLMDLRSATDRAKRRLSFSKKDTSFEVVPFPIEYLKERSFELPGNLAISFPFILE